MLDHNKMVINKMVKLYIIWQENWDCPGGPEAKTPKAGGLGLIPCQGNWIPHATAEFSVPRQRPSTAK